MNPLLNQMSNDFLSIMKSKESILGAWNFGSVTHSLDDEYSDVDLIFLVEGKSFGEINNTLITYLEKICDEVVLCWPEVFNSEAITNYGFLLKKEEILLQFDVFLLNSYKMDDFMCRIHYTDLRKENVFFDKVGDVEKLIKTAPKGEIWKADINNLYDTYWFHMNMTIKYIKRKDFFKLNNVMRILMDTHVSLLLAGYDCITWGGTANKLHFIPKEKQEHIMRYGCSQNFEMNMKHLLQDMKWFAEDYKDVCNLTGIKYDEKIANEIMNNWNEKMKLHTI